MRILIISNSAWDSRNATGNTYVNWFHGEVWEKDVFSNFYLRSAMPNNPVCTDYYRVTPQELLRKIGNPGKIGLRFQILPEEMGKSLQGHDAQKERKCIDWLHRNPSEVIYAGMDWLFRHRGWENRQFVAYLKSFDPDIVFASLAKNGMWKPLLACIQNNTHAKIVLNASDDIYGAAKAAAWYRRKKLVQDVEWCVAQADRLYGQSVQICDAYGACFGRVFTPIYKGCTFEKDVSDAVHRPIRIVYAGNLFYGRADSLSRLADVLEKINGDGLHMTLQIYTGADVTPELDRKLNRGRHSRMMGRRSYEEIKDILHDADIVLQVESFEQKQMNDVHYSFSTKIIDCLQSGCAAMGIGPAGIASIEYLRGVPGAVVVDDLKDLERAMTALLLEGDGLLSRAAQTRTFAVEHHDLAETQRKLHRELEALL